MSPSFWYVVVITPRLLATVKSMYRSRRQISRIENWLSVHFSMETFFCNIMTPIPPPPHPGLPPMLTFSPNYTIPNPTVFVLTSIYAKVLEKRWRSQKCHVTSHQGQSQKSKGHPWSPCASNLVQFRLIFTNLRHFEKNGTRHFSLIGRHLESVSPLNHTGFQTYPSPKWKMADPRNFYEE